ncbi:MAG: hypothetical protein KAS39_07265 [Actinomycetia bacterium]|nr:hypothetical protein [Actinomycetes bacterium]
MIRKTKIISTIGPVSFKKYVLKKLIKEGTNFIRINTSYGSYKQYDLILENLETIRGKKDIKVIYDIKKTEVLNYFKKKNLDIVAVSFTESKEQLQKIQNILPDTPLIAKIESKKGIENFDEILKSSWGIMIARGDLGKAVSLEKIPCIQRDLVKRALKKKKFLIVATEMLLSMTDNPSPSRAEVSDVATAVFEKASAVMLSEETAIGKYPVLAVKYMRNIINEAEKCC